MINRVENLKIWKRRRGKPKKRTKIKQKQNKKVKRRIVMKKRGAVSERMSTWMEGVDYSILWCCSLLHSSKTQRKEGEGEEIYEKENKRKQKEKRRWLNVDTSSAKFNFLMRICRRSQLSARLSSSLLCPPFAICLHPHPLCSLPLSIARPNEWVHGVICQRLYATCAGRQ